jgi:glycosyltransferase involved in cell wall biosynthesis
MHSLSPNCKRDTSQQHICIVTETYPPEVNGVALTLSHLVKGLRENGHTVSIIPPRQREVNSDHVALDPSTTLVRGLPLPGYRGLQFGLPAGRLFHRTWTRDRPHVVYVATEGPLGWSAVCAAEQLNIPAFSGFHTNYHSYSRHYRLGWLERLVFKYLCGFHNRSTGTLVPTADLRDRLQSLGFRNVSFMGRGVDSYLFTPRHRCDNLRRDWGVSDSDLTLLYVGRLAPEKNLALAVEAYRSMKKRRPSIKFVIVGDGPLRASLQNEHQDLIFRGTQTGEQLAKHYASADIFLFPSETETFGNVTLEAMASGLVVVAYDYAAARIHIRHGETGILVPYGESKAFVNSSASLVWESQSIERIGRRAREYVSSIKWSRVVERFESLVTGRQEQLADEWDSFSQGSGSMITPRGLALAARGRV